MQPLERKIPEMGWSHTFSSLTKGFSSFLLWRTFLSTYSECQSSCESMFYLPSSKPMKLACHPVRFFPQIDPFFLPGKKDPFFLPGKKNACSHLRWENRPANRPVSRETGLEMPCCPASDLLWVQITQNYPNRLRFSSLPCPQSSYHALIFPVFQEGFF
jgi:hypothetical protein